MLYSRKIQLCSTEFFVLPFKLSKIEHKEPALDISSEPYHLCGIILSFLGLRKNKLMNSKVLPDRSVGCGKRSVKRIPVPYHLVVCILRTNVQVACFTVDKACHITVDLIILLSVADDQLFSFMDFTIAYRYMSYGSRWLASA